MPESDITSSALCPRLCLDFFYAPTEGRPQGRANPNVQPRRRCHHLRAEVATVKTEKREDDALRPHSGCKICVMDLPKVKWAPRLPLRAFLVFQAFFPFLFFFLLLFFLPRCSFFLPTFPPPPNHLAALCHLRRLAIAVAKKRQDLLVKRLPSPPSPGGWVSFLGHCSGGCVAKRYTLPLRGWLVLQRRCRIHFNTQPTCPFDY